MKTQKVQPETVNRKKTDNTMAKIKSTNEHIQIINCVWQKVTLGQIFKLVEVTSEKTETDNNIGL